MSESPPAIAPPFDPADQAQHLARAQQDLAARGLRAGVLFDPESIYWLTGYQSIGYFTFQGLLVPAAGRPVLVSRRVNEGLARATPTLGGFRGIEDTDEPVQVLSAVLEEYTAAGDAVGLETGAWYFPVQAYRALTQAVTRRWTDWGAVIDDARIRKTAAQLACMRHAGRAAVAGLDAALRAVAPGRTENVGSPKHVSASPPPRPVPPLAGWRRWPRRRRRARTIARRWRARQGRREVGR